MKAFDIIKQFHLAMPQFNDYFSAFTTDFTASSSGSIVTVTTANPHGLSTGNVITMTGIKSQIELFEISLANGRVTASTFANHDLTRGYQENVTLSGSDNDELNGTFELLDVPNRRSFVFDYPGVDVDDPGTVYLLEDRSYGGVNGIFNVTVVDDNTFTYDAGIIIGDFETSFNIENAKLHLGIRISGASDIDRAVSSYTEQSGENTLWGFVIVEDAISSKDRNVTNDATLNQGNLNEWNVLYLEGFSFYVVVPTTGDITGRRARDLCEEIKPAVFSSVLGKAFDSGFSDNIVSPVVPLGDQFFGYFKSYYIHQYRFEQVSRITNTDIKDYGQNVAFRDIEFNIRDIINPEGLTPGGNDDTIKLSGRVNLDDDALGGYAISAETAAERYAIAAGLVLARWIIGNN